MANTDVGQGTQAALNSWIASFMGPGQQLNNQSAEAFRQFLTSQGLPPDIAGFLQGIQGFQGGLPGAFQRQGLPPELQQLLDRSVGTGIDRATDTVNAGGRTEQSAGTFDRFMDLMNNGVPLARQVSGEVMANRGFDSGMAALMDMANTLTQNGGFTGALKDAERTASGIISAEGQNAQTNAAFNDFRGVLQAGGRDAQTNQLSASGQQLINQGGMTPEMSQLLGTFQRSMAQGGMTPESSRLFGEVMKLVEGGGQGGALIPMQQVQSFAKDAAATASRGAMEGAIRSANQRMGSALGSGVAESARMEFADAAAQNEAQALREATLGQQGLQLDQLKAAMGAGTKLTGDAQALMGQFGAASADIARSASSNIATGGRMMSDAEQVAANRFGTAGQGLTNTMQTELGRLQAGSQLMQGTNQLANQRMGTGLETGRGLEAIASNNMSNAMQSLIQEAGVRTAGGQGALGVMDLEGRSRDNAMNSLLNAGRTGSDMMLGSGQLDLNAATQQMTQWLTGQGMSMQAAQNAVQNFLGASTGLGNLGGQQLGLLPGLFSGQVSNSNIMQQLAAQPGFWSNLGQSLVGGAMGGLTGGLAGGISNSIGGLFGGKKP